jgi:hypothetical protein
MKKIYKILFTILLFFTIFHPAIAHSSDTDNLNSKSIIRSIWKYEQDFSQYGLDDGIAKKIYFLSLNSDGTYHQYVQVIPSNPKNYYRVKNYEINGRWYERNGKLVLEEYGKENPIDYNFIYTNFENIDNQFITKK